MGYFLDTDWDKVIDDIDSTENTNVIESAVFSELPFERQVELAKIVVNDPAYSAFNKKEAAIPENASFLLRQDLENYNRMVRILKNAGEF